MHYETRDAIASHGVLVYDLAFASSHYPFIMMMTLMIMMRIYCYLSESRQQLSVIAVSVISVVCVIVVVIIVLLLSVFIVRKRSEKFTDAVFV